MSATVTTRAGDVLRRAIMRDAEGLERLTGSSGERGLVASIVAIEQEAIAAALADADARVAALESALAEVGRFAKAHHGDQDPNVWLHALVIDIQDMVERALAAPPVAPLDDDPGDCPDCGRHWSNHPNICTPPVAPAAAGTVER